MLSIFRCSQKSGFTKFWQRSTSVLTSVWVLQIQIAEWIVALLAFKFAGRALYGKWSTSEQASVKAQHAVLKMRLRLCLYTRRLVSKYCLKSLHASLWFWHLRVDLFWLPLVLSSNLSRQALSDILLSSIAYQNLRSNFCMRASTYLKLTLLVCSWRTDAPWSELCNMCPCDLGVGFTDLGCLP